MENSDARNLNQQKKSVVHIEYCTNCQSHNWNTHHNEAKYHQTYIKLKNLIESSFKPNPPIVTANKVPHFLLPIKEQENKYYNQLTKKYMFFPNIGSFQITLNDEIIFSKKKTNNWPCFQTVLNQLSIKLYNQPFLMQPRAQKQVQTNQTETQFSSDEKIIPQGSKTLYKHDSKNSPKNFGKFTLTNHFKSFHAQSSVKTQEPFYFDSSTTIKQSSDNSHKKNINVEDIDGLRKALKITQESHERGEQEQGSNQNNDKEILINLSSIEQEGTHIKEITQFRVSNSLKKTSGLVNSQPLEISSAYNSSEKSLSLKRFQELNNDLKKIQKQFQHIEKKMIISDSEQKQENELVDESRINHEIMEMQKNQNSRNQSQSGFTRSKFDSKENFIDYHLQRYSKQNKLLAYITNIQNSRIKATDRYDDRYNSPTHYEENDFYKNLPSKKYSEIEKYLKANNEEKNKKLKKIYGDWKVGSNLNYLYNLENGKNALLRDSTNTNSQSKPKNRVSNNRDEESSSDEVTSESSNSHCKHFETSKNSQNMKLDYENPQIKKHSSFIIKNKSLHKNSSTSDSRQKISKYSLNEKSNDVESNFFSNKNVSINHQQPKQHAQIKQAYAKQNSKSFQAKGSKTRPNQNPFAKREKYSLVQNSNTLRDKMQAKRPGESNQKQLAEESNQIIEGSCPSKSNNQLSASDSNDPTQRKVRQSSKESISDKKLISAVKQSQIKEIKEVELTEQSSNRKNSNRITIQFHEFSLKVKSTRRKNSNIQNASDQNKENSENGQLKQEKPEENQQQAEKKQNKDTEREIVSSQRKKEMSITQQVYVQLNLHQMSQSQIMKTKSVDGQFSNSNQKLSLPHLNFDQKSQDPIKSNLDLKQTQNNIKSISSNSLEISEAPAAKNHHSRSSSLYKQATFSHAVSHDLHETNHCKCQQRIEQLETNRMKLESQRKEKQVIKQKKYQQNLKRKEIIEKQKQEYLKQLQIQIKEKQNSNRSPKNQLSSKRSSTQKPNLPKQRFLKETNNQISKVKRAISNNVQGPKSPLKNMTSQNKDLVKQEKIETKVSQNKPTKSISQAKNHKIKQENTGKKRNTGVQSNSKDKSQSKNTFSNKKTQQNEQSQKEAHTQKAKIEKKQSKSISSKIHEKPNTLTKKANNQRNKSYFMIEKEKKLTRLNSPKKGQDQSQIMKNQKDNQMIGEFEVQKEGQRSKCTSIAIQTMGQTDWRKYDSSNTRERTNRNKSVQSRNSQIQVKSPRQSIKSRKNQQIIKEAYSPIQIEIKGGKTKTKKLKYKEKSISRSRSRVSKKSRSPSYSSSEKSQKQSHRSRTIVNIFEKEQNPHQLTSELDIEEKLQVSFRSQRQKALLLKQLYNMDGHIENEVRSYENLYNKNCLYQIAKRQIILQPSNPIFHALIQKVHNNLSSSSKWGFTQVENTVEGSEQNKLSLFGTNSISIHKLKSNQPYLTKDLHKVLHILAQKNQLLIVRLFEDYKSETNFFFKENRKSLLIEKSTYGVWLCINKTWKLTVVDNVVPMRVQQSQQPSTATKPYFSYHEGNQVWPQILQKSLAQAVGGYTRLFDLSIGQLFSILTGSNHLAYTINENLSKNKHFIKEVAENDKKNFTMVCQKYPMNLKQENDKTTELPKIFYLLSKKIVHNGQSDQILFKMRQSILDQSTPNTEPYYIRYDKFCQKFKTCEVLHLRQHNNFCSLPLNQTFFTNKNKKSEESYFNVIELVFDEQNFGTITVCNEIKSDIRTYLYKLQNSDNQIMKLVGEASKLNKKELFFDCYFQEQKYYLFIQSSNPNSVVSFMGEGKPQIKVKEQILSNGLKNQLVEYLPVSNYEGLEAQRSVMGRPTCSNFYSSQVECGKKVKNMEDLREMFIELLIEEKKRK